MKNEHPFPSLAVITLAQKYLSPTSLVLDVGCNRGQTGKILKKRTGCRVFGIDNSQEVIKEAKEVLNQAILADIELDKIDFDKELFDLIILSNILEHLKSPLVVLKSLKRHLKPDGYFLIAVPNIAFWQLRLDLLLGRFNYQEVGIISKDHLRFFTLKTFKELLADDGLEITEITTNYLGWRDIIAKLGPTLLASQFVIISKQK